MEVLSLSSLSLSKQGVDFSYWGPGITYVFNHKREIGSRAIWKAPGTVGAPSFQVQGPEMTQSPVEFQFWNEMLRGHLVQGHYSAEKETGA